MILLLAGMYGTWLLLLTIMAAGLSKIISNKH
jgi:hypothetical protein